MENNVKDVTILRYISLHASIILFIGNCHCVASVYSYAHSISSQCRSPPNDIGCKQYSHHIILVLIHSRSQSDTQNIVVTQKPNGKKRKKQRIKKRIDDARKINL